jgi:hypothetical protein
MRNSTQPRLSDDGVIWGKFEGLLDQLPGLGQAHVAICKRIAQRVVSVVVIRFRSNQRAQQALHFFQSPSFSASSAWS